MHPRNPALLDGNPLKLGVFGPNCSSGRTYTTIPERWVASWENNLALAQLADQAGIEALIPIARWKGYSGETDPNGSSFESIVWASGMLATTRRISVFCTVHVPLHHPLVAAKQLATADHLGEGRLGLNLVCGWNEDEFKMFGIDQLDHQDRYAQGAEWWQIVKRLWAGEMPFDFEGVHYQLRAVQGAPRPWGGQDPPMMNAGSSTRGRDFAIQYSDLHFDSVRTPEASAERVADTKRRAREAGRALQVWTPLGVVCRPSQGEAEEYVEYLVEHADWGAIGYLSELFERDERTARVSPGELKYNAPGPVERKVLARGAYCAIGDPDHVARELIRHHEAGFDGLALNFTDYLGELPYFVQEVLPRLERQGLRA